MQSSIKKHFGLDGAGKSKPKESGMAELLCSVYDSFQQPLSHEMVWQWHSMLFSSQTHITDRGTYRTHAEPMQIVSNRYGHSRKFFEAPPSDRVFAEMSAFIEKCGPSGIDRSFQTFREKEKRVLRCP